MADPHESRGRRDVDETTRRLLEAAAAEFVEHGYDRAVVSDIARRAGVTTGAVYARWPHKSDVMVAALDRIFDEILPEQRIKDLGDYSGAVACTGFPLIGERPRLPGVASVAGWAATAVTVPRSATPGRMARARR